MARYNLNFNNLSPLVREAAKESGLSPVCRNPFQSIVIRSLEVLYACDEAIRIIDEYEKPELMQSKLFHAPESVSAARKHRADCFIIATNWTKTALFSTRRSFRRLRKIRKQSKKICANLFLRGFLFPTQNSNGSASRRFAITIRVSPAPRIS